MIIYIDYIGGAMYPDVIEKWHPRYLGARFLIKATGWPSGMVPAKRLAKSPRSPKWMGFHGLWHDNHKFERCHIRPARIAAKRVANFAKKYPYLDLHFSPWLEAVTTRKIMEECLKECRKILPARVRLVASYFIPNHITEIHGNDSLRPPGKYFFSYDGQNCLEADIQKDKLFYRRCEGFGLWIPECNGKYDVKETTPRPNRTHYLKRKHIRAMRRASR